MSNLWFNIRFGSYHLQYGRDDGLTWHKNSYWVYNKPSKWFCIYQIFGKSYAGE